jgi:histidinol-phosphate aminotransferase
VLHDELQACRCVHRIYPSDANFLLVKVDDADALYAYLRDRGIIVRNRNRVEKCIGCIRITVGTIEENETLIQAINDYDRK